MDLGAALGKRRYRIGNIHLDGRDAWKSMHARDLPFIPMVSYDPVRTLRADDLGIYSRDEVGGTKSAHPHIHMM